ncbi:MAG: c-type cytochrome [Proteobacteria bacterium]|nr:c-type cytochrome [Pseudomonadota bacterium]
MKRFLTLLAGALAATTVLAADHAPAVAGDPAKGQQIVSTVCSACHNADGNSSLVTNPKLAGQHAEYLVKQMKNFKGEGGKPAERINPVMNAMIAAYNDEQMRDIGAFLSVQQRKGEVAKNPETIEFGRQIFRAGDQAKGLPACAGCHGPAGGGVPAQYPRLSGQFAEYTEAQLRGFRAGERTNDVNKMMRMVTIKMTDAEIKAVSDYIAGLR